MRFSKHFGTVIVALALGMCGSVAADAEAKPGRIAFSSDGSIVTINADGSGRRRLTEGNRYSQGPQLDTTPFWSPDGSLIAFQRGTFRRPDTGGGERWSVWVMDADGRNPRMLLGISDTDDLLGFTRRGEVLVERRWKRGEVLFAIDTADGTRRRLPHPDLYDLSLSPDGRRVAGVDLDSGRLAIADLDGSHERLLTRKAYEPSWSRDSRRIAFVSEKDHNGEWCATEECDVSGEIYVIDRDGRNERRITFNKGDDRDPRWSPDGRRIAFESDRNWPAYYNTEIYSIRADGRCLTWLTNGSAESLFPDWRPGAGNTSPGACGGADRRPLIDLDLSRLSRRHYPLYWFGRMLPGRMILSDLVMQPRDAEFWWADCGYFDKQRCGDLRRLTNMDGCRYTYNLFFRGRAGDLSVKRGALLSTPGPPPYGSDRTIVFTGTTTLDLDRASDIWRLRRYPDDGPPAERLPEAAFPEWFYKALRRVEESYAHTHSEEKTAAELGISPAQVHRRHALARRFRELGVDQRQECPAPQGNE